MMRCPGCGKQVDEAATLCWNCNARLTSSGERDSSPVLSSQHIESAREEGDLPSGEGSPVPGQETGHRAAVGGWLLYLCISLTILSPAVMLVQFMAGLGDDSTPIGIAIEALFTLGPAVYSIVVGILLWTIRRNAVRHARVFFIVMGCLQVLSLAIAIAMKSTSRSDYSLAIRSLISVGIWLSYLSKSRRVAETFRLPFAGHKNEPTQG